MCGGGDGGFTSDDGIADDYAGIKHFHFPSFSIRSFFLSFKIRADGNEEKYKISREQQIMLLLYIYICVLNFFVKTRCDCETGLKTRKLQIYYLFFLL